MKTPDPNAGASSSPEPSLEAEVEDPQAQQVDVDDADVSAEPSQLPPGLPPLPPQASLPPAFTSPPSGSAPATAPAAPSRSAVFYVGILAVVLLVGAAIGTVVALSRRGASAAKAASPTASAPKVITIRTVEMDDNPDSGP